MDIKKIKADARKKMEGHYKDAIIMILVSGLAVFAVALVGAILDKIFHTEGQVQTVNGVTVQSSGLFTGIFSALVTCALTFGEISYFLKISRGKKADWKELFSKTNLLLDFFMMSLLISLFTTLWTLLLIIPGIIAAIAYSQAYYLKLDEPKLTWMETIKKSKEIMNGHKWDYFMLNLSFLGWAILGVFTFGLLYFWLVPYMQVSLCNFYNKVAKK